MIRNACINLDNHLTRKVEMFSSKKLWRVLCVNAFLFPFIAYFQPLPADPGQSKPSLSSRYPIETLREVLLPRSEWHPFATLAERDFWNSLPGQTRRVHLARAEQALGEKWPVLPATLYLEFSINGNRSRYEDPYFERRNRLANLVLAECMEAKGRFMDEIVNGVWVILEESSWVIPAHIKAQRASSGLPDVEEPVVDLFSAETGALLAWIHYLIGPQLDEISPLINRRLLREASVRVLRPCLERDDFWWMGFSGSHINNWNPWCNSNWLTANFLLEGDNNRRVAAVEKILRSLDLFISSYHPDGGCDEGPSYWGRAAASLFDCLELLRSATNSEIDIYNKPLIQQMGRFIYRTHIDERYFINFADAPAKVEIAGDLVYRFGKRIGDKNMAELGAYAAKKQMAKNPGVSGSIGRALPALVNLRELISAEGFQPHVRDVWLDGIQVMAARSRAGTSEGLYLAAKGGHNAESHNHNDVGNFIVYVDGRPLIVDAGVGTYTRKTFSDKRYEIWTMQSAYHNLPTINGVMQKEGRTFAARDVRYKEKNSYAELSMDIAGAYPESAGVISWKRAVRLVRGKEVRLVESYRLAKRDGELMISLITPCKVDLDKKGLITLTEKSGNREGFTLKLNYPADKLTAKVEKIDLEDKRLQASWGESLARITLRAGDNAPLQDTWRLRIMK